MSRVLRTGENKITNTYANHNGWSKGVDVVKKLENGLSTIDDITAHTDGTVIKVVDYMTGTNGKLDRESMGYGNYVMILHKNKYRNKYMVTLYAHLAKVDSKIKEGVTVVKGQVLGVIGNTGGSSGAHLHHELRLFDTEPVYTALHNTALFEWIDPTPYLDTDLPTDPLYRVQTGSFLVKDNAVRQAKKLIADGFPAIIKKHGLNHRVQVGAYTVKSNAINMENRLKAKGYKTYITTESGIDIPF